ncbi:bifunctional salicylyl-CoA 5-hydroxylase/oxidoreductase [Mycobacterium vicinigordonae]|uniref:Bifunctional salicylyl-CoA 5-hydroxylase/oxidoreductase n=1 Tax=Mycobacterium vicinigordonae TaxID=1719132 RepID=A0A7D6E993_9MYCO|nr:bifunctional salicylyl-CoA 5-hydroxylase/oxidoreductase [Mycobacterium vicinigordonae]QLL07885.1 bifunctional salicylyl-CoA 5-hydroxylase/oxidoreductase [Mycobacterium vicinigordonae]
MQIAIIGGGPGGLYFAALVKQLNPHHQVTVWERNAADDTFGFGVVFSDETLDGIALADTAVYRQMEREFARWEDIDIHLRGTAHTSGGHGFAAMSRKRLLCILQARCHELGVQVHFNREAPPVEELMATADLVVAADGVNSATRNRYSDEFGTTLENGKNKYIWLGTDRVFEAFTFVIREESCGVMQVHAYPYGPDGSTVIVEMRDEVWRRGGFDQSPDHPLAPGESDERSISMLGGVLGDVIGDHRVLLNNSRWSNFTTVRNRVWRHGNLVLLGDAAHTAHFSIGSGTKLAMEDALTLAACLHEHPELEDVLQSYESERRPVVESTQRAAQASLEWFENIAQYVHQDPRQFAFNILTRSRRITHENLRTRDPRFTEHTEVWYAEEQVRQHHHDEPAFVSPPMFQPYSVRGLRLKNRVLVSSMDMYCSANGVPGDFHLVHLGSKALGGAALVMTEMVCVSPIGRITPGCAGLYTAEQERSWRRIVDFVHAQSDAKIGVQLGHSGRKGSTRVMWEGIDEPLSAGNWRIIAPSPLKYGPDNQTPREVTRADLDQIAEQFVDAAAAAARAGFDLLELHCAHGYLLSSFLSPLSNIRTDEYGGCLDNRLRFPLRVFDAVRDVWPSERPMSVRISATDWAPGGIGIDDAVEVARAFAEHGADIINVSTGQVVKDEAPAYGRSYQTPFADRIRNEVGSAYRTGVVAVGAISSYDDANSVLLAGRADLVAIGRTHLYDPHWTLHAAADQDYSGPGSDWIEQFKAGSRKPPTGNTEKPRPRLELMRNNIASPPPRRWTPATMSSS